MWLFNWRSVWYWTDLSLLEDAIWTSNIYALENPLLSLYFILTLLFFALRFILPQLKKKMPFFQGEKEILQLIFFINLTSYLPLIFVERTLFLYHYLIVLPFNILLLSYLVLRLLFEWVEQKKRAIYLFNIIFWPLFFFILFYPNWVALAVPNSFANATYFFLKSWK